VGRVYRCNKLIALQGNAMHQQVCSQSPGMCRCCMFPSKQCPHICLNCAAAAGIVHRIYSSTSVLAAACPEAEPVVHAIGRYSRLGMAYSWREADGTRFTEGTRLFPQQDSMLQGVSQDVCKQHHCSAG